MASKVAECAKNLAARHQLMSSYWAVQQEERGWFFARNGSLGGLTKRPASLASFDAFQRLSTNQRQVILNLAGVPETSYSKEKFGQLKKGWSLWPTDAFAAFWGTGLWACNIFVGEVHHCAGKNLIDLTNRHYYDANTIWRGSVPNLAPVEKYQEQKDGGKTRRVCMVSEGDIAAMLGGHHVEIVTRVNQGITFCSRGAGRSSAAEQGAEKCGGSVERFGNGLAVEVDRDRERDIENERVRFFRFG